MAEKEPVEEGKKAEGGQKGKEEEPKTGKQLMVPKTRLDEEIAKRKTLEDSAKTTADAKAKSDADALAEQGKYKELYEKQVLTAQKAEAQLAKVQVDTLKKDAATAAGHPQLWDRIVGDTDDAIKADMALLADAIPKAKAPDIDGATGSGKRSTEKDKKIKMSDAQKTYLAGILGVAVKNLPDEVDVIF